MKNSPVDIEIIGLQEITKNGEKKTLTKTILCRENMPLEAK